MNAFVHKIPDLCPWLLLNGAGELRQWQAPADVPLMCSSAAAPATTGSLMVGTWMALWGPILKFECFTMYALVLAFCKSKYTEI